MKRVLALILSTLFLFSSCSHFEKDSSTSQKESTESEKSIPSSDSESSLEEKKEEINFIADLVSDKIKNYNFTDESHHEKIKTIYDDIISSYYFVKYLDPTALDMWRYLSDQEKLPTYLENRSISPLLYDFASCEDFAAVLTLLLREINLNAQYISGYTLSVDGIYIDHAWVMVEINGNYYHLDPQLEQNVIKNNLLTYRFFLKSDEQMNISHKWGENLLTYFSDILDEEEINNIKENHLTPLAENSFDAPIEPIKIDLPEKINFTEVYALIEKQKYESQKDLNPIFLNVNAPILIEEKHITPKLLKENDFAKETNAFDIDYSSVTDIYTHSKNFLAKEEKNLYDEIFEKTLTLNTENTITIDEKYTEEKLLQIIDFVYYENPLLFFAQFTLVTSGANRYIKFDFIQGETKESVAEKLFLINKKTNEILQNATGSNYDKALYIHNYLALKIAYDTKLTNKNNGDLYGALVDRKGVCDAYSKAFLHLMQKLGFEVIYIRGKTLDEIGHSWNALKMDGNWYYFDVTWDRRSGMPDLYHTYFALSREEIEMERVWDVTQYPSIPETTNDELNYYVKNDFIITMDDESYVEEELAGKIAHIIETKIDFVKTNYDELLLEIKIDASKENFKKTEEILHNQLFEIFENVQRDFTKNQKSISISFDDSIKIGTKDNMQILQIIIIIKK